MPRCEDDVSELDGGYEFQPGMCVEGGTTAAPTVDPKPEEEVEVVPAFRLRAILQRPSDAFEHVCPGEMASNQGQCFGHLQCDPKGRVDEVGRVGFV